MYELRYFVSIVFIDHKTITRFARRSIDVRLLMIFEIIRLH